MDSVLQSREADPEEVLINLGFAESEAFAKIPLRFLKQPSKVNECIIYKKYKWHSTRNLNFIYISGWRRQF